MASTGQLSQIDRNHKKQGVTSVRIEIDCDKLTTFFVAGILVFMRDLLSGYGKLPDRMDFETGFLKFATKLLITSGFQSFNT